MKSEEERREAESPSISILLGLKGAALLSSPPNGYGCCKIFYYEILRIKLSSHISNSFLTHKGSSAFRGGSSGCFLENTVVNPLKTTIFTARSLTLHLFAAEAGQASLQGQFGIALQELF